MIGICGVVVILKVAADAIGRSPDEHASCMALLTGQAGMGADEGKARRCCVIKSAGPAIHAMAGFALC